MQVPDNVNVKCTGFRDKFAVMSYALEVIDAYTYRKNSLVNRTTNTLMWYVFYDLQPGNGVGPIPTAHMGQMQCTQYIVREEPTS